LVKEKFSKELLRVPRSDHVEPTGAGVGWGKALVVGREGGPAVGCIVLLIGAIIVGGGREVMLSPCNRSREAAEDRPAGGTGARPPNKSILLGVGGGAVRLENRSGWGTSDTGRTGSLATEPKRSASVSGPEVKAELKSAKSSEEAGMAARLLLFCKLSTEAMVVTFGADIDSPALGSKSSKKSSVSPGTAISSPPTTWPCLGLLLLNKSSSSILLLFTLLLLFPLLLGLTGDGVTACLP